MTRLAKRYVAKHTFGLLALALGLAVASSASACGINRTAANELTLSVSKGCATSVATLRSSFRDELVTAVAALNSGGGASGGSSRNGVYDSEIRAKLRDLMWLNRNEATLRIKQRNYYGQTQ